MEKKKVLILLTDEYPYGSGETFVATEASFLTQYFSRVIILTTTRNEDNSSYQIPYDVEVFPVLNIHTSIVKIWSLRFLFSPIFWQELNLMRRNYKLQITWKHIKVMMSALSYAAIIKKHLFILTKKYWENKHDLVIYSYWMGNKALAAAMLAKEFGFTSVCRAHSWDILFERHQPPYLPFRKFIYDHLKSIYFISEHGRNYFLEKIKSAEKEKCPVAYLGTKQTMKNPEANGVVFTICSCAAMIDLKRLHLIPEILSHIEFKIHWIHFGSGALRTEIEKVSAEILSRYKNISFEFKGQIPNEKILDFYASHHIDLFLLTSRYEGIPVAIMESLSAGIPVMATRVGGIAEIVNDKNGFLLDKNFNTKEAASVISGYYKLPEDAKIAMRENAYLTWEQKFNAAKNYPAFIQQLQSL